jgi:xylan 1,4-beta-xylosidase
MPPLRNPILPGFNPDPSILYHAGHYYICTSTFEWYPGLQIHTSPDLSNWTLHSRPLSSPSLLDLRGVPDSCGIWAPCLSYSHSQKKFYIAFTIVTRKDGSFKDTHNYIISSPSITGPWSERVYVNSSGFDPSLFHDEDTGKKYFVNMVQDHRRRPRAFAGIVCQEWDPERGLLVGERRNIFKGTELDLVEGPHLYKRNGWYYLLTAEGGTGYEHACTLARARSVWGPYELHPETYILSSRGSPGAALQRARHGDLVETPEERTYLVHLAGRPVTKNRRCVLGRETAIQECEWRDDDWLYVKNGPVPSLFVDVPGTRDERVYWEEKRYIFDAERGLSIDFQWLRTPEHERIFRIENNKLVLIGRESIGSWFEQSLVARRQTHFSLDAETVIDFSPEDERQFAGLTAYYCRYNFFYLTISGTEDGERELLIMSSEASWPDGKLAFPMQEPVKIPREGKVKLALTIRGGEEGQFWYALAKKDGEEGFGALEKVGKSWDASVLSDECGGHHQHGSFTGCFVGVACSDLNGSAKEATFDYFVYRPVEAEGDSYEI